MGYEIKVPWVRFDREGDRHGGQIVEFRREQAWDFNESKPMWWSNEQSCVVFEAYDEHTGEIRNPLTQDVITVETGVADENGETERRIFVAKKRQKEATKNAVAKGAKRRGPDNIKTMELGGTYFLTRSGSEKVANNGKGKKVALEAQTWEAEYAPPADEAPFRAVDTETIHLADKTVFSREAVQREMDRAKTVTVPIPTFTAPAAPARASGDPTGASVGSGGGVMVGAGAAGVVKDDGGDPPF